MNEALKAALSKKILPVIVFYNADDALYVAEAFLKAGLNIMEVPMRTSAAPQAIENIRKHFPAMHLGAGTLLTKDLLQQAINAGAQFGLSAGLNLSICEEAKRLKFPFVPGVMTPSEIDMAALQGFDIQKVFPVNQIGGADYIKAVQEPYAQLGVQFIPMGGINVSNMQQYLQLQTVIAVGGSWVAPKEMIVQKKFTEIEVLVSEALAISEQK